jgi:hypothetical protein
LAISTGLAIATGLAISTGLAIATGLVTVAVAAVDGAEVTGATGVDAAVRVTAVRRRGAAVQHQGQSLPLAAMEHAHAVHGLKAMPFVVPKTLRAKTCTVVLHE